MAAPTGNGRQADWVLIRWEGGAGVIMCPNHGALPAAAEYIPGPAACGCLFVTLPGGVMRAIRAAQTAAPEPPQHGRIVQADGENAG
jgi:hypothetical protein